MATAMQSIIKAEMRPVKELHEDLVRRLAEENDFIRKGLFVTDKFPKSVKLPSGMTKTVNLKLSAWVKNVSESSQGLYQGLFEALRNCSKIEHETHFYGTVEVMGSQFTWAILMKDSTGMFNHFDGDRLVVISDHEDSIWRVQTQKEG